MSNLLRRHAAVEACIERFAYKPVVPGVRDCAKLAAMSMHKMGRSAKLLNASRHKTFAGALKYIRKAGFANLVELMDATGLEPIAPAAALPGDIIALPSGCEFGCSLSVAIDNGRVLFLNPQTGLIEPGQPLIFVKAWRV